MKRNTLATIVFLAACAAGCGKEEENQAQWITALDITEEPAEEESVGGNHSAEEENSGQQEQSEAGQADFRNTPEQESGTSGGAAETEFSFADMEGWTFYFSSGAGAWYTELSVNSDGTFAGHYQDADMGDTGVTYPNGTLYYCDFTGSFEGLESVNEFVFKTKLNFISTEQEPETEEVIDGVRYVYSTAYGLEGGEKFYIYLPGTPLAGLPEEYRGWVGYYNLEALEKTELGFYGLYNVNTGGGFSSAYYGEQSLSDRVALELSLAEERDAQLEAQLAEAETQQDLNEIASELYGSWDDALNTVWKLLEAELDTGIMERLRTEEREWIAEKEAEVEAAGQRAEGGTMQALEEALKAAELTKARVYELAGYAEGR